MLIPSTFSVPWILCSLEETILEASQTSKIELYAEIVNSVHRLSNFKKSFVLDAWLSSECASISTVVIII